MAARLVALALLSALMAVGCGKRVPSDRDGIAEAEKALDSGGFHLTSSAPSDPAKWGASRCFTGTIDRLDALECEFATADAARASKGRLEAWVGAAPTGIVLDRGRVALVLADRQNADRGGRTIAKISRALAGK